MKLAYALLITSRKLSHYFQAHEIEVHTSSTLGEILNNREATGKIAKWAIELSMYDIIYKLNIANQGSSAKRLCGQVDRDKVIPRLNESSSTGLSTSTDLGGIIVEGEVRSPPAGKVLASAQTAYRGNRDWFQRQTSAAAVRLPLFLETVKGLFFPARGPAVPAGMSAGMCEG
jgi:hypothetical protein